MNAKVPASNRTVFTPATDHGSSPSPALIAFSNSAMIALTMSNLADQFVAPSRVLLGPGPSDVPPRVLQAMASPTIGHLVPKYLRDMDKTRHMLRQLFQTKNEMTMAVSGTGSAGMEAA